MINEFTDASQRLTDIERAERAKARDMARKCDWDDPTDVALYRSQSREEERVARLPRDMRCPTCLRTVKRLRQWVTCDRMAICRSCYFARDREQIDSDWRVLEQVKRYVVDGGKVAALRKLVGISQAILAEHAGWSRSYQQKMEKGLVVTLSEESASTLLEALARCGILTQDVIPDK